MTQSFDISRFRGRSKTTDQYERQLSRLARESKQRDCIERAVRDSLANLRSKKTRFVIYGEPQSGKTEMMICLTAKLLDQGHRFIIHMLNDSVDLLGQNLGRFKESGLAPSARNFSEILDPLVDIRHGRYVVFCKKNANDLRKLIDKIGNLSDIVVIDDEADYASPNSKINQGERTKINELISKILGKTGIYIGVTATPARLDLNNTFQNDSGFWVNFSPHRAYTGQDDFFPLDHSAKPYRLTLLPHGGDDPKYARRALFSFLVNVAYLNSHRESKRETNYSFLMHTSGKKVDHKSDWKTINNCLSELSKDDSSKSQAYLREIWEIAKARYADADPDDLTNYILNNISRYSIIVLNSERDWKHLGSAATNPTSLFTIIIGGNIVSRGVTLDNLLSMFFTRDVKHKIQQDTYIQRARMFGNRGSYLSHFELTIPESLYLDWHRCFVFHRLALEAIRQGQGSLVWLGDKRVNPVANTSIDRSTVDLDKGEMAFKLFVYNPAIENIVNSSDTALTKMEMMANLLGSDVFPDYLRTYVERIRPHGDASIAFHPSASIEGYRGTEGIDMDRIERRRGFIGRSDLQKGKFPDAVHHFKVYYNREGNARLFYKFEGSIQFIKNLKNDT